MPISEYYGGKGERVLRTMQKRYGAKEGKKIFYATANARHLKPPKKKK